MTRELSLLLLMLISESFSSPAAAGVERGSGSCIFATADLNLSCRILLGWPLSALRSFSASALRSMVLGVSWTLVCFECRSRCVAGVDVIGVLGFRDVGDLGSSSPSSMMRGDRSPLRTIAGGTCPLTGVSQTSSGKTLRLTDCSTTMGVLSTPPGERGSTRLTIGFCPGVSEFCPGVSDSEKT